MFHTFPCKRNGNAYERLTTLGPVLCFPRLSLGHRPGPWPGQQRRNSKPLRQLRPRVKAGPQVETSERNGEKKHVRLWTKAEKSTGRTNQSTPGFFFVKKKTRLGFWNIHLLHLYYICWVWVWHRGTGVRQHRHLPKFEESLSSGLRLQWPRRTQRPSRTLRRNRGLRTDAMARWLQSLLWISCVVPFWNRGWDVNRSFTNIQQSRHLLFNRLGSTFATISSPDPAFSGTNCENQSDGHCKLPNPNWNHWLPQTLNTESGLLGAWWRNCYEFQQIQDLWTLTPSVLHRCRPGAAGWDVHVGSSKVVSKYLRQSQNPNHLI